MGIFVLVRYKEKNPSKYNLNERSYNTEKLVPKSGTDI